MSNRSNRGVLAAALSAALGAGAANQPILLSELADLDLEQLAQITVTSPSRRPQSVLDAAASIFVITAEDIRRSGATSLPEALRIAPNLQVVRGDTSQHIATARGGLSGLANKMLVLVDGRTVYSPLFSGVFTDALIVPLEDIERIEVISGPGSTLWGTNAVNGVINVTSRAASGTQGALLVPGTGNMEQGIHARIGAPLSGGGHYRAYARYYDRDEHRLATGASARDAAQRWQTGFRGDWGEGASRGFTLQGDLYAADVGNLGGDRDLAGGNLLARWRTQRSATSQFQVQAYYDRTEREHAGTFKEERDTVDLELQHLWDPPGPHRLVWGGGYRASRDRSENTPALGFMPPERTLGFASLYAQDEIDLSPRLKATLGLRAERNSYTGVEWLPNARLSYIVSPDHVLWGAFTHTVRAPARLDRDLVVPGFPPFTIVQNDSFRSEFANVAEVGYRARIAHGISVSFTAFHHEFRALRTLEPGSSGFVIANGARGRRSGLEGWGDFAVTPDWRLVWGFALMDADFSLEPGLVDLGGGGFGNDPKRTASLRSLWNVTRAHELDLALRHVGALPDPALPSYTVVDARLGWRISPNFELSLTVANALDREYSQFGAPAQRAVFEREYFLRATLAL